MAQSKKQVVTSTLEGGKPTIVAYGPSADYGEFTRAHFEGALKKVAKRQPKPSRPDGASRKT